MRLTLRTMLAYLDDVLEPEDAQELGSKIEDSEFATGLVHRIRSSTRRLRLGAPGLGGKGMGLDPNTVAEYLDSLLPPDRVPDFEKVCLESDVHLAEVASCHQILTLVLGEAAEVEPEMRHRMYLIGAPDTTRAKPVDSATGIPAKSEDGLAGATTATATAGGATAVANDDQGKGKRSEKKKRRIEVPDYLRAGSPHWTRNMAIALVLAFVVTGVALRLMGPFNGQHPLLGWFGGEPAVAEVTPSESPDEDSTTVTVAPPSDGSTDTTPDENDGQGNPEDSVENAAPTTAAPDNSAGNGGETTTTNSGSKDSQPKIPPTIPADIATPPGEVDQPDTPPATPADKKPVVKPVAPTPETKAEPAEKPPTAPVEVGYVRNSEQQFLVRFDDKISDWSRLPARTKLFSGERIAALPTYRPEIVLAPSVQVKFAGAAHAVLSSPEEAQGEPGMALLEGRMFVGTAGVAGARVHLDLGGRAGTLTFADAASEAAIDVSYFLRPGANPEQEPGQLVVKIFAPLGRIQWQEVGAPSAVDISPGQARIIAGNGSQAVATLQLPAWIRSQDLDGVERMASQTLEPFASLARPIGLSLNERTQDRKAEVRALAARCLAHLDNVEAVIEEFNDDRQRSFWDSGYIALRKVASRSPGSATKVRETFERVAGDQAGTLYRLLAGFSPQQLAEGDDATLVNLLDSEELNIRVLAFQNLRRITNKTLYYRPDVTAARRKSSIKDWEQRLEKGEIVYDSLPTAMTLD